MNHLAYVEGYDACYEDLDPEDCPYDQGSPEADDWMKGYEDAFWMVRYEKNNR